MVATGAEGPEASDRSKDLPDVCVVTHPLAAAGENATRSLLDILAAVTNVALVTADLPADSEIRDDREVVELTEKGAGDSIVIAVCRFILNQIRMCDVIWRRDEPVVLFFGATSYLLPILFARLIGKTVLLEPRGDVPLTLRLNWEQGLPKRIARALAGLVRGLERVGFRAAHGIITYTPSMARELALDPESDRVFASGARYVRTDEFTVRTPYDQRDSVVGFVGRLDEEKGIRELADVARDLPDDLTFRFVGDGNLRDWLESLLAAELETGQVEMVGWVAHDEVPEQLNEMKLLVHPSRPTEGLPTTILEGLACGTPVYASPVSGIPDVVRDGETGFLMKTRDPKELAEEVESILNRSDLQSISENGRELILAEFTFDAACDRYTDILSRFA